MKKDYVVEPGRRKLFVELHRRKLLVNFAITSTGGVKIQTKCAMPPFDSFENAFDQVSREDQ